MLPWALALLLLVAQQSATVASMIERLAHQHHQHHQHRLFRPDRADVMWIARQR